MEFRKKLIEVALPLEASLSYMSIDRSEQKVDKALAYRLFTIAERKGWAQEAYAYNSLVIAWPEVQAKAAELKSRRSDGEQMAFYEGGE